ncbi:hypothetical protein BDY24DRAFT_369918 [Mrakia frigida]|uniref:uncharacterized protein n=1 Tax=Mrakia frigida TaxID=29902 RepID=UPI003FCC1A88
MVSFLRSGTRSRLLLLLPPLSLLLSPPSLPTTTTSHSFDSSPLFPSLLWLDLPLLLPPLGRSRHSDTGTIFSVLSIFLCLQIPKNGALALNWRGNLVFQNSESRCLSPLSPSLLGPTTWPV